MKVSTETRITLDDKELHTLWGMVHHHLNILQLDTEEKKFKANFLMAIDPEKGYENTYEGMSK
jgi:hypothetical protein